MVMGDNTVFVVCPAMVKASILSPPKVWGLPLASVGFEMASCGEEGLKTKEFPLLSD